MKTISLTILSVAGLIINSCYAGDLNLSAGPGGVMLDAGEAGKFTLPPPKLLVEGGNPKGEEGILEVADEKTLTVKYDKASATITLDAAAHSLTYALVPQAGVKSLRVLLVIPITFAQGGQYSFGGKALKPLPATQGDQFVEQTGTTDFTLINSSNAGFTLTSPQTFQELADTRLFGMDRFVYAVFLKADTNDNKWTLKFSAPKLP
ncbi:hypothetical protein BH09VER1_BH09VER1_27410 [soil metagenome]